MLAGDQTGYEVALIYFLELDHTLWGFFPAIVRGTKEIFITTDPELAMRVWGTLTRRKAKLSTNRAFVNATLGVAYPIVGSMSDSDMEQSEPLQLFTAERVDALLAENTQAFHWAPGLVGNNMTAEEFRETLRVAAETHGVVLPE